MIENHIILQKLKSNIDNKNVENLITDNELNNIPYDEIIQIFNYLFNEKQKNILLDIVTSTSENNFKTFIDNVILRTDDVLYIMRRIINRYSIFEYNYYPAIYEYYFKHAKNIRMSYNLLMNIHEDLEFCGKLNIITLDNFNIRPNFIKCLPRLSSSPLLIEFIKKYHENREYMECLFKSICKKSYIETIKKIIGYGYPINLSSETIKKLLEKVFNLDNNCIDFVIKNLA
jgi:hypothetical protein